MKKCKSATLCHKEVFYKTYEKTNNRNGDLHAWKLITLNDSGVQLVAHPPVTKQCICRRRRRRHTKKKKKTYKE